MQEQVTSFEISQRLEELGFECWNPFNSQDDFYWFHWGNDLYLGSLKQKRIWLIEESKSKDHSIDATRYLLNALTGDDQAYILETFIQGAIKKLYPAYSCWDLFMWLRNYSFQLDNVFDEFEVYVCLKQGDFLGEPSEERYLRSKEPQNALGLAVIAILEEK